MRISTSWSQQLPVSAILEQQSKQMQTQMQLSTGKRIITPADDPVASVRLIDLEQATQLTAQYQKNIVTARERLRYEESNLQNVVDTLGRIKELTVEGLNGSLGKSDRNAIALELDQLNDHLVSIANTQNANGEYIFAGYKTGTQPYVKGQPFAPGVLGITAPVYSYPYSGDQNQRSLQIGPSRQVADGDFGEAVFGVSSVGPGTTPTIDQPGNLFEMVSKLSASLKDNNPQSQSLADLDAALNRISTIEATIGARTNALDRQETVNDDYTLNLKSMASDTGDLNYAEAASKLNLQNVALQAAQQAYAKVQGLSLFNYIR